jgi:hypothetical protein
MLRIGEARVPEAIRLLRGEYSIGHLPEDPSVEVALRIGDGQGIEQKREPRIIRSAAGAPEHLLAAGHPQTDGASVAVNDFGLLIEESIVCCPERRMGQLQIALVARRPRQEGKSGRRHAQAVADGSVRGAGEGQSRLDRTGRECVEPILEAPKEFRSLGIG